MQQDGWLWTWSISIPSRTEAGAEVMQRLLDELEKHQWDESAVFGIHLSVEEALINAIKHGNGEDERKRVHVSFRLSESKFFVEIIDEGDGFDPRSIPDPTVDENLEEPGGRGLMLMQTFMNRVEYNDKGNRILMEKWT